MLKRATENILSPRFIILLAAVVVLFIFCVSPFLSLFQKVLFPEGSGLSFQLFKDVLESDATRLAIANTFVVATLVTVICLVTAVPIGWIISRTDIPGSRRLRSLLCLPFAVPPYIGAIAWIYLANPSTGLLNRFFENSVFNIYSIGGLVFVESSFLYTFILLTTLSSLDRMDSSFEEAARLSGASPWRVFMDISLPILRPALISGGLLVFLATTASFGVPALIGGPARIYLMTTQIYTFQKMGTISGLLKGGALSGILICMTLALVFVSHWISRHGHSQTVSGKTARPSIFELGVWRWLFFLLISTWVAVVFLLPLFGIVVSSLSKVQGNFDFSNFSLSNWHRVIFELDETPRALMNSITVSFGAATIAVVLGFFISYLQTKTKIPGRRLLDVFASLPYITPGTVVALALIMTFSTAYLGIIPSLYNTLTLIMVAYVVKYLSFAVKTTTDGYHQVDDVLAEASRVSGASWMQTMYYIWLPLLRPALVAAWFLVFMPAMSELTMTTLLTGPGLETMGTVIFQLQEYADASGGGASVLAVIVILVVIAINWTVKKVSKGKYGL